MQALASAISSVIAALALIYGVVQLRINELARRRNNAEALWREYELLCIEHPRLAAPDDNNVTINLSERQIDGSPSIFTQYEYFVSFLLYACDSITEAYKKRPDWDQRLIPLRPGPQNVVVAGHVRDRTNHEHDGYG
jgi:hypothetical protein